MQKHNFFEKPSNNVCIKLKVENAIEDACCDVEDVFDDEEVKDKMPPRSNSTEQNDDDNPGLPPKISETLPPKPSKLRNKGFTREDSGPGQGEASQAQQHQNEGHERHHQGKDDANVQRGGNMEDEINISNMS